MSYRLAIDRPIEPAIQRVAREQIDKALVTLDSDDVGIHDKVHEARKRCKKIRGLVRLVRPSFKHYDEVNAYYRDAARSLAELRDSQSVLESLDSLMEHFKKEIKKTEFSKVRKTLLKERKHLTFSSNNLRCKLDQFYKDMERGKRDIKNWQIDESGFEAIRGGYLKTYGRARKAYKNAYDDPCPENFHEWRKRAKYHRYHVKLLRSVWEKPIKARLSEVKKLTDFLGDDHDLFVLKTHLLDKHKNEFDEESLRKLLGLINQKQIFLRYKANKLGASLFAESEKNFIERYKKFWRAEKKSRDMSLEKFRELKQPVAI